MQQVITIITKLWKPVLGFLNGIWKLVNNIDEWYKGKNEVTKCSIRWGFICTALLVINVINKIDSNARVNSDNIRATIYLNNEKRAREECEKERIRDLKIHIDKLEKYNERIDENSKKIEEAKESKR